MGPRKEEPSKKGAREEGSKNPIISCQEHVWPVSIGLEGYRSMVDQEYLSLVHIRYCILEDYEIELLGPDSWIDNFPPSGLGVYEEVFKVGLKFPLPLFILELLRSYGIPLCVLTPNSIRFIMKFLGIYFLPEI